MTKERKCGIDGEPLDEGFNQQRAVVQVKPESMFEISPGSTTFADIQIFNDTYWPWKKGCKLAFDTREVMTDCPIEPVCVTIAEKVKGKQPFNLSVPLTVNPQVVVSDPDAVHTIHLAFQGPKG